MRRARTPSAATNNPPRQLTSASLLEGTRRLAVLDPELASVVARLGTPPMWGRRPGIGPWTVDIDYLMALRRPDVWPRGDLALASAIADLKGLDAAPTRVEQEEWARYWAPWRSVAARILWMHDLD